MFPRWLSWVVFLFLGYMVYSSSRAPHGPVTPLTPQAAAPVINEKTYPALAQTTDVERWKRALDPHYAAHMNCTLDTVRGTPGLEFKVIEDAPGAGEGASCGMPITVHLTVWNASGAKAYETTVPLNLGSRELAAGFDYGLLGIKPDGVRTLVLPPYAYSRAKGTTLDKAVLNALPVSKLAVVTVTRIK